MDAWWTDVATATGWLLVVSVWGLLTNRVANALVIVGLLAAAILATVDGRFDWHAEGLAVMLVPTVGLYAAKLLQAGTIKGLWALGAILGLGATPALYAAVLTGITIEKVRGKPTTSERIYLLGIALASVMYATHTIPARLM